MNKEQLQNAIKELNAEFVSNATHDSEDIETYYNKLEELENQLDIIATTEENYFVCFQNESKKVNGFRQPFLVRK